MAMLHMALLVSSSRMGRYLRRAVISHRLPARVGRHRLAYRLPTASADHLHVQFNYHLCRPHLRRPDRRLRLHDPRPARVVSDHRSAE